ncbi:MAG: enoyl-CoA hydratase [Alphaproteobacteria bacterium]
MSEATVRYETPAEGVARVVMARGHKRNAQDLQMTYELNDAFDKAARDDSIKVIILAADDPVFSAGHDLSGDGDKTWRDFPVVGTFAGFDSDGAAGRYGREMEIYIEMTERWRNLAKPTIAQVQGKCVAGGLMLAWACDLIVCSDDAQFRDPVVEMGIPGVEFFQHAYEVGVRKAKEWLFTSDWIEAEEAKALGMVNQVVPRAALEAATLGLAQKIATKPMFALRLTKQAVNFAQDQMGRRASMQHAFGLHHLAHTHNLVAHGIPVDPGGIPKTVTTRFGPKAAAGDDD